ncbi:MAG: protease modulator HflC [Planctomycetes bacterium]|nr:protease modulator HflC [Planctomycetota bacterium]
MKNAILSLVVLALAVAMIVLLNSAYVVRETEQVVITQFGEVVGEPVTAPGLYFRVPFLQKPNYLEKRVLEWDGNPNEVTSKDRRFISVDTFARWRIVDPRVFFERVIYEEAAQSRLDDILDGETRSAVANHRLIEVLRDTTRALPVEAGSVMEDVEGETIRVGRSKIAALVLEKSRERARSLGIEVLDFRFKRINYGEEVRQQVYQRMRSERERIAAEYRAEGEGEAARIRGRLQRDLKQITSEAYRQAQEIRGAADAEAAAIYSEAYTADPEFYRFCKTLSTYEQVFDADTLLLLGSDGDFLEYLQHAKPTD